MTRWHRFLRAMSPAVGPPPLREMLRACIGAGIGLTLCTFLVRLTMAPVTAEGPDPTLLLIAPLGATAMLAFAHCGFNGSLQHRLQISLLGFGIARSFWAVH